MKSPTFALLVVLGSPVFSQDAPIVIHSDGYYLVDAIDCLMPLPSTMIPNTDSDEHYFYSNVDVRDPNYESQDGRVSVADWMAKDPGTEVVDDMEITYGQLETEGPYTLATAIAKRKSIELTSFYIDNKVKRVTFSGGLFGEER